MTSGKRVDGGDFQQAQKFLESLGFEHGNLIDKTEDASLQCAVDSLRRGGQEDVKEALTRYRDNFSLENLVELSIRIGENVLGLCHLSMAVGIPLDRIFKCILDNADYCGVDENMRYDPRDRLITKVWELLNQIRSEQEFEQQRIGGENWKADQVYADFNKSAEAGKGK